MGLQFLGRTKIDLKFGLMLFKCANIALLLLFRFRVDLFEVMVVAGAGDSSCVDSGEDEGGVNSLGEPSTPTDEF
jgi:hypothetical protein